MKNVLVTGSNGEVGTLLIKQLKLKGNQVITLDLNNADYNIDITNFEELRRVFDENSDIDTVIHLAAILSTSGEKNRTLAHKVNAEGTFNLLELSIGKKFIFPSSIAVYGMPNVETKNKTTSVNEREFLNPQTIYGVTKLYGENLGNYFDKTGKLDFRSLRFPGLISSETVPSGGTSDFGPEMLHYASKKEDYQCFVREDTKMPFMLMTDAISAIMNLAEAEKTKLSSHVYNVSAFSLSAKDFENKAKGIFSEMRVDYKVDEMRQKIVDSWPTDMDDSLARKDWGWKPKYLSIV